MVVNVTLFRQPGRHEAWRLLINIHPIMLLSCHTFDELSNILRNLCASNISARVSF